MMSKQATHLQHPAIKLAGLAKGPALPNKAGCSALIDFISSENLRESLVGRLIRPSCASVAHTWLHCGFFPSHLESITAVVAMPVPGAPACLQDLEDDHMLIIFSKLDPMPDLFSVAQCCKVLREYEADLQQWVIVDISCILFERCTESQIMWT